MYRRARHSPISPANSQGPQRSQKQIYKVNKSHKGLDFSENFFVFLRLEFGRFQVGVFLCTMKRVKIGLNTTKQIGCSPRCFSVSWPDGKMLSGVFFQWRISWPESKLEYSFCIILIYFVFCSICSHSFQRLSSQRFEGQSICAIGWSSPRSSKSSFVEG